MHVVKFARMTSENDGFNKLFSQLRYAHITGIGYTANKASCVVLPCVVNAAYYYYYYYYY